MLKIPIHCYGKEKLYDGEEFYAIIKSTAGNSIKFEMIDDSMAFYIQKDISPSTIHFLRQLAMTHPKCYMRYNHDQEVITILTPITEALLAPTNAMFASHSLCNELRETENVSSKSKTNNNKGENMNLKLKDKLFYGEAPHYFGVSFDGRITFKDKAYNPDERALIDTLGLSIQVPLFILPQTSINAGDVIYVNNPDKSSALYYDGNSFIDYETGQIANYAPTKVFNMSFYSVVKNPLAGSFNGQNQMNNLLPLLLLKDGNRDNNDLFLMMAMSNGGLGNLFGGSQKPTNKTE